MGSAQILVSFTLNEASELVVVARDRLGGAGAQQISIRDAQLTPRSNQPVARKAGTPTR